jgi:steroid 5-alpha reductase family enzyme
MELLSATFILPLVLLWVYMSLLFVLAVVRRDNSIADIGYGMGFVVTASTAFFVEITQSYIGILLYGLVLVWALRLSTRIYRKNRGKPEDFRYAAWRASWKYFYLRSYLQVFMLQGAVIYIVSLPVLFAIATSATTISFFTLVGVGIWVVGFICESIADWQLDRFIKNPENRGKIMQTGLWRYSRHPNYFGESSMWWGMALAASSVVSFPLATVVFVSPILITFLLLKVSGIPLLEARFAGNPQWEAYKARTSAFIPLPPRP